MTAQQQKHQKTEKSMSNSEPENENKEDSVQTDKKMEEGAEEKDMEHDNVLDVE